MARAASAGTTGGMGLLLMSPPPGSWLAQGCSQPRQKGQPVSTFQPCACVTLAHILLAKACHMGELGGGGDRLSFFGERNCKVT